MPSKSLSLKLGWIGFLAIVFFGFSTWYGGNGKPISPEDGAAMIAELRASYGPSDTDERGFAENMESMIANDDGKEFYAVNLEQLKTGDAARAADDAYARTVMPLLFKRASHPVFVSQRAGLMLGEYGEQVDRVVVVRYRSLRDLLTMTLEPSMIEGSDAKFLALDHTEVFITRPTITFVHVRLMMALLLILIGGLGWRAINFVRDRRRRA
ncbi:MAG: hypothetical protein ACE37M_02155 [Henriciella sp.]